MRFFRRSKDQKKSNSSGAIDVPDEFRPKGARRPPRFPPTPVSAYYLSQLPPRVLERIFAFVCPHTQDESYESCEGSANEKGCMLCDLRDLSHCAKVNRNWRRSAIKVL